MKRSIDTCGLAIVACEDGSGRLRQLQQGSGCRIAIGFGKISSALGDRVTSWITLNEPWCSAYLGYGIGVHAPGLRDRQAAIDAAHHLLLGHGLAVSRMRANLAGGTQVGITLSLNQVYGANERAETARDMEMANACYTDMGWEIYPRGLRDLLVDVGRNYAVGNLYVTENGAAFPDAWDGGDTVSDPRRVDYLRSHITACAEAIEQGAPLRGYFVWSLMDNFEWAEGYTKRFGIIYIDYPTQRRVIKESGHWYARLLRDFGNK